MKIIAVALLSFLFSILSAALPAGAARMPIIDAHSQVEEGVEIEDVIKLMDKGGIARTILSTRRKVKVGPFVSAVSRHPDRITPALRTKGFSYNANQRKYYRLLKMQKSKPEFAALAEVILYHAQKGNMAPEISVLPDEPQAMAALEIALERKWPFIAHIEFAAIQFDRDEFMKKFEAMAAANPKHPFVLIHMGQLPADDVARLIAAHPNVFFLTSRANTVALGATPGQPWVNLLKGNHLAPRWKKLIIRHPERFILGFDNVWADDWGDFYLDQIELWRKALTDLPPAAAHALAHGNAERLWRLPPAKLPAK